MDALVRFFNKLWILVTRQRFDSELEEEMAFHREQQEKALQAEGMTPEEAHYAAMRQFGNATRVKEDSLETVGFRFETVVQDFRYAFRQLRGNPGFALTTIVILGLGIGASTAIFSAVNPILFETLPYPDAGRMTMIWDFGNNGSRLQTTFGTFREVAERSRSFEALAAMKPWQPTLTGSSQPERFEGQRVSASYFRVLGVLPAMGRDFQESDDLVNGPDVVILSNGLWRRRFGGDGTIVGRQIKLNGYFYTVIGVMPDAFENILSPAAELWAPLQYDRSLLPQSREWGHHLSMVGRLRSGVGIEQARRELDRIAHAPVPEFSRPPHAVLESGLMVNSLQSDVTSDVKPALLAVVGAVILVLLIACVNVTNLLLARGAQRRGEFAMRAALGAARPRLMRQMLTESLFLAFLGGVVGMMVAKFGVRALVAISPPELPRAHMIHLDGAVFAFGFGITALIGLVVGLFPALHLSRSDLYTNMQLNSRRTAGSHRVTRGTLVVAEVAIALVLLVSAGLLLRSLQQLFAIDPGFDGSHLLTLQVQTAGDRLDKPATERFFTRAVEEVRRIPGVTAAAFTSQLPLSGEPEDGYGVHFESSPTGNPEADNGAFRYAVSPGYFETMSIPLRRGRMLDTHDVAGAPLAVVINESMANKKFPSQDPIGQRLRIGPDDGPWYTIVGVVGNVKQTSLALSQVDAVYITSAQWQLFDDRAMWFVVRAGMDAAALTPVVRRAIWSVDKDQPIVRVATMEGLLATSAAQRHFAMVLFAAFALAALVLAATGMYGLLSGSVTERMREIGVRAALGASRRDILELVIRQGMTLTGIGVVIGLTGAAAASQALVTLLFGVSRLDPFTYIGVVALLGGVSIIACGVPAWRAAQVDPSVTLRAE
jgi:putative ABC transport system permease protein